MCSALMSLQNWASYSLAKQIYNNATTSLPEPKLCEWMLFMPAVYYVYQHAPYAARSVQLFLSRLIDAQDSQFAQYARYSKNRLGKDQWNQLPVSKFRFQFLMFNFPWRDFQKFKDYYFPASNETGKFDRMDRINGVLSYIGVGTEFCAPIGEIASVIPLLQPRDQKFLYRRYHWLILVICQRRIVWRYSDRLFVCRASRRGYEYVGCEPECESFRRMCDHLGRWKLSMCRYQTGLKSKPEYYLRYMFDILDDYVQSARLLKCELWHLWKWFGPKFHRYYLTADRINEMLELFAHHNHTISFEFFELVAKEFKGEVDQCLVKAALRNLSQDPTLSHFSNLQFPANVSRSEYIAQYFSAMTKCFENISSLLKKDESLGSAEYTLPSQCYFLCAALFMKKPSEGNNDSSPFRDLSSINPLECCRYVGYEDPLYVFRRILHLTKTSITRLNWLSDKRQELFTGLEDVLANTNADKVARPNRDDCVAITHAVLILRWYVKQIGASSEQFAEVMRSFAEKSTMRQRPDTCNWFFILLNLPPPFLPSS